MYQIDDYLNAESHFNKLLIYLNDPVKFIDIFKNDEDTISLFIYLVKDSFAVPLIKDRVTYHESFYYPIVSFHLDNIQIVEWYEKRHILIDANICNQDDINRIEQLLEKQHYNMKIEYQSPQSIYIDISDIDWYEINEELLEQKFRNFIMDISIVKNFKNEKLNTIESILSFVGDEIIFTTEQYLRDNLIRPSKLLKQIDNIFTRKER